MKFARLSKKEAEQVTPAVVQDSAVEDVVVQDADDVNEISLTQDQLKQLSEILPTLSEILPALVQLINGEATIEIIEEENEEEPTDEEADLEETLDEEAEAEEEELPVEEEPIEEIVEDDGIGEPIGEDEINEEANEEEAEIIEEEFIEDAADEEDTDKVLKEGKAKLNDAAFEGFAGNKPNRFSRDFGKKPESNQTKSFASRWK